MDAPNPEFGVLLLGILIGFILSYGFFKAEGNLRSALIAAAVAIAGGPPVFWKNIQDAPPWAYPMGLTLGLLVLRAFESIREILDVRENKGKRVSACTDLLVIIGVTMCAAVWTW